MFESIFIPKSVRLERFIFQERKQQFLMIFIWSRFQHFSTLFYFFVRENRRVLKFKRFL